MIMTILILICVILSLVLAYEGKKEGADPKTVRTLVKCHAVMWTILLIAGIIHGIVSFGDSDAATTVLGVIVLILIAADLVVGKKAAESDKMMNWHIAIFVLILIVAIAHPLV